MILLCFLFVKSNKIKSILGYWQDIVHLKKETKKKKVNLLFPYPCVYSRVCKEGEAICRWFSHFFRIDTNSRSTVNSDSELLSLCPEKWEKNLLPFPCPYPWVTLCQSVSIFQIFLHKDTKLTQSSRIISAHPCIFLWCF